MLSDRSTGGGGGHGVGRSGKEEGQTVSCSPHLEESWEGMSQVILLFGVRGRTVLHTFLTRKTSQIILLHLQIFCFILRLTWEQMKVTDYRKGIRDFSVQPLCFPSLKCCIFLFYFRIRVGSRLQSASRAQHENYPKGPPRANFASSKVPKRLGTLATSSCSRFLPPRHFSVDEEKLKKE